MAACTALVVVLFNTAQRVTANTEAVNAADGAAYSAAVWSARHLNFLAYTNRAMVANHVAAGHLVAYVSWIRYVDAATEVSTSTAIVRGSSLSAASMGAMLDEIRPIADAGMTAATERAQPLLQAINTANALYADAQSDMADSLARGRMEDLMQRTVREYDADFRVNDAAVIREMPGRMVSDLQSWLGHAQRRRESFIARYRLGEPGERFDDMIARQFEADASLRRWILGPRGWGTQNVSQYADGQHSWRQRKLGSGTQVLGTGNVNWQASDTFQASLWFGLPLEQWASWQTLASASADADSLVGGSDGYDALKAHYDVAAAADSPGHYQLPIAVMVSKDGGDITERGVDGTRGALDIRPSQRPVTAVGAAEAYFDRPDPCASVSHDACARGLGGGSSEYSNLFNPFWRVRLSDYTFLLNQREPRPWL